MSQLRYWIWLTTVPGVSLRTQLRLIEHFGTPEAVFLADREALKGALPLSEQECDALERRDFRIADQVLEDCRREKISILTIQDAAYPHRLRAIDMPPLVLYYQGTLLAFDALPAITVVGARNASGYGLVTAKQLGFQMAACGGVVISGAARGIDSLALEGALSTGAPVAAVLGNGLDIIYPYESRNLYEDIRRQGCLISEYVPGTKPLSGNFPRRNRIMSGLSLGVLVVEAAKRSGSLITADFALEQGRDVYAVPGNIGLECCAGSNALIQDGAQLVTCGWDVLQSYQSQFPTRLRRWKGGDRTTLSPQDRRFIQTVSASAAEIVPEEAAPDAPISREKPSSVPEKEDPVSEKRIDNGEKRNYIDLQQIMAELTEDERTLVTILQEGQRHVDDIIADSGIPAARVLSSLTLLEIKGYVTQQPGKRFDLSIE